MALGGCVVLPRPLTPPDRAETTVALLTGMLDHPLDDMARHPWFGDELEAMLGVRVGRARSEWRFDAGNGYFIGASYRELAGARFVGVTLGYTLDVAAHRQPPRHDPTVAPDTSE